MHKQIENGVVTIIIDDPNEINLIIDVKEDLEVLKRKCKGGQAYLPLLNHAKLLVLLKRLSEGLERKIDESDVKNEIFRQYEELGGNVRYINQKNNIEQ